MSRRKPEPPPESLGPEAADEEALIARWKALVNDHEALPDEMLDRALQRLLEVIHRTA